MEDRRAGPSTAFTLETLPAPAPTARLPAGFRARLLPRSQAPIRRVSPGPMHTDSAVRPRLHAGPQPVRRAPQTVRLVASPRFASPLRPEESPAIRRAVPERIPPAPTNAQRTTAAFAGHAAQSAPRG